MLINWFTVGAQTFNFLILVWLMGRFVYGPILHAIDEREKRIAARIDDATAKEAEALSEREAFKKKNEDFDQQRTLLMTQSKDEVEKERARLMEEVRDEADSLRIKRKQMLAHEHQTLSDEIGRRILAEAYSVARHLLTNLAGTSLEERMSHVFVSRLQDIDGDEMNGLADALRTSSGPAVVCSALELPPEQQDLIQKAIQEAFPVEVHVEFETDEALIGGIELTVSGRRIAWSVENQLAGMETRIANLLEQGAESSTAEDTLTEEPLESGIITPAAGESP